MHQTIAGQRTVNPAAERVQELRRRPGFGIFRQREPQDLSGHSAVSLAELHDGQVLHRAGITRTWLEWSIEGETRFPQTNSRNCVQLSSSSWAILETWLAEISVHQLSGIWLRHAGRDSVHVLVWRL